MSDDYNSFLIIGAGFSAVAAAMHIGCIFYGASWYRFFGAGERMAQLSLEGSLIPTYITSLITAVLISWSFFALSGAGVITKLPLVRLALCGITSIYLLRGIGGLPLLPFAKGRSKLFWWWSSAICLFVGILHLVGLVQVWNHLGNY